MSACCRGSGGLRCWNFKGAKASVMTISRGNCSTSRRLREAEWSATPWHRLSWQGPSRPFWFPPVWLSRSKVSWPSSAVWWNEAVLISAHFGCQVLKLVGPLGQCSGTAVHYTRSAWDWQGQIAWKRKTPVLSAALSVSLWFEPNDHRKLFPRNLSCCIWAYYS